ncbi:MAG: alpha/beta hydrolase-fold protein [Brevinematales bacterium]|nr:alpha/beta hydrolase-fold protein [Brevinematales bacterium]
MERWLWGIGILMLFAGCAVREDVPDQVKLLFQDLDRNPSEEVFRAWVKGHAIPWVEQGRITFFLWDERATHVVFESPVLENKEKKVEMKRYKKTPLFYVSFPLQERRVMDYSFLRFDENTPNGKRIQDPSHPFVAYTKPLMSRWIAPGEKKGRLLITNLKPSNGLASRRIFIYLPWEYGHTTNAYPVLYMQDGQNLWDSSVANFGGWKVDTTLDRLIAEQKIQPLIVVGIENSSARAEEYVGFSAYYGFRETYDTNEQKRVVEYSKKYLEFVVGELIPYIKSHYRVLSGDMAVAGSSFGAGVSLYLGFSKPEVFRAIGAFSFGNYRVDDVNRGIRRVLQVQPYLSDHLLLPDGKHKIYLDCGGRGIDSIFVEAARKLHSDLVKKGWKEGKDYLYIEEATADHNEVAWAKRFERFVIFLWGK